MKSKDLNLTGRVLGPAQTEVRNQQQQFPQNPQIKIMLEIKHYFQITYRSSEDIKQESK